MDFFILEKIEICGRAVTARDCEITYNTFNKTKMLTLKSGSTALNTTVFTYGPDNQRRMMTRMEGNSAKTIYTGLYQVNGGTERLHYIDGPEGMAALIVTYSNNSTRTVYYLQTDYQGSLVAVYNSNGTLNKQFSYDPWGRWRNPANWSDYTVSTELLFTRGYTGHEHLDDFGLINMNGRVYDPRLARFLSPDNGACPDEQREIGMQAPTNTQSYNRYSYCLNNPMKYTDPSGEKWWHWALGLGLADPITALTTTTVTGGSILATANANFIGLCGISSGLLAATLPIHQTISGLDYTKSTIQTQYNIIKDGVNPQEHIYEDDSWIFKDIAQTIKIDAGLLMGSPSEGIQTILGNTIAHYRNLTGQVTNVEVGFNYVLVNDRNSNERQGLTLGSYVNGWGIYEDYKKDPLFVHEYGHTFQSKVLGPLYMNKVGYASGISGYLDYYTKSNHDHDLTWFEIQANQIGQKFYTPKYKSPYEKEGYPTSIGETDWKWFLLFNPFMF